MLLIFSLITLGVAFQSCLGESEQKCDPCKEIEESSSELEAVKQWIETAKSDISKLQNDDEDLKTKYNTIRTDVDDNTKDIEAMEEWVQLAETQIENLHRSNELCERRTEDLRRDVTILAWAMVGLLKYLELIPQDYDFNQNGINGLNGTMTTMVPHQETTAAETTPNHEDLPTGAALEDETDGITDESTGRPNVPRLMASMKKEEAICIDNDTVSVTQNSKTIFITCGSTPAVFMFDAETLVHKFPCELNLPKDAFIADITYGKSYEGDELLLLAVIFSNDDYPGYISQLMSVNIVDTGLDCPTLKKLQEYNFVIESHNSAITLSTFDHPSGRTIVYSVHNSTLSVIILGETVSNDYDKNLDDFGRPIGFNVITEDSSILTTSDAELYLIRADENDEKYYIINPEVSIAVYATVYRISSPIDMAYMLVALDDDTIVYVDAALTEHHKLLACEFPPHASTEGPYRMSVWGNRLLIASTNGYMLVYNLSVNAVPHGSY